MILSPSFCLSSPPCCWRCSDGGYGDLVYDQATDTFVYVSYRGTGIHGSGEIVQCRFRLCATDQPLIGFRDLVRKETWTEKWPDDSGEIETRSVTEEIWTAAMQASLEAQGLLHIPARKDPYYLDGPLILKSGQSLTADPQAEIRLKPGCNTCMVRNANLTGFKDRPVPEDWQAFQRACQVAYHGSPAAWADQAIQSAHSRT